jgi:hypothetical protein
MGIPPFYTAYLLKHTAIQKLVRSKMELSKINKVARFALNSTVALGYYSPTASNEETITTLMEKDIMEPQKEKVEKLLTFQITSFIVFLCISLCIYTVNLVLCVL